MKKLAIGLMLMMISGSVFAGAVDPCGMTAYSYCAKKLSVPANDGPNGSSYCKILNPRSAEFKACEADAKARCKKGEVLEAKNCFGL